MHIYLFDLEIRKNVKLELSVNYALPGNGEMVAFYALGQTLQSNDQSDSEPFDEFVFKKLTHIVAASTQYDGKKYSLTIGYYLENNEQVPFLIDQMGDSDFIKFATSPIHNEQLFSGHIVFNYKAYMETNSLMGLPYVGFREYVQTLISRDEPRCPSILYRTESNGQKTALIDATGLDSILKVVRNG